VENLREVLNEEKEPEVGWAPTFTTLVAGGMEVKEATIRSKWSNMIQSE
jgi:hypothetical protein